MEKTYYLTKEGDDKILFETNSPKQIGIVAQDLLAEGVGKVYIHNRKNGKIRTLPKDTARAEFSRLPRIEVDEHKNVIFVWNADNPERNDSAVYETHTDRLMIAGKVVDEHPKFKDLMSFRHFVHHYFIQCMDGYNLRDELNKITDITQMAAYINKNHKTWRNEIFPYLVKQGWANMSCYPGAIAKQGDKILLITSQDKATIVTANNRMELVEKLQTRIKHIGLPMAVIAERSGIDLSNLYKILRGTYNPSLDLLERVAKAVRMKIDLVEIEDE